MPLGAVSGLMSGCWFGRDGGGFGNRRGSCCGSGFRFRGYSNRRNRSLHRRGDGGGRRGFRSCHWSCGGRLDDDGLLGGARLAFADDMGRWRLDHHGHHGRRGGAGRTRHGGSSRRLGHHGADGRTCGNGGRRGRRGDDGRRGAGLGNDLARLRASGRGDGRRGGDNRRRGHLHSRRNLRPLRHTALPRFGFLFLLLGQDGLQHVAGLGDMREINLGRNALRGARGLRSCQARGPRSTLKMRANLVGLIVLQRTGVGLAGSQAEFRQNIENLPALDFHLAREIVDTNLTHPPLFKLFSKAVSRS